MSACAWPIPRTCGRRFERTGKCRNDQPAAPVSERRAAAGAEVAGPPGKFTNRSKKKHNLETISAPRRGMLNMRLREGGETPPGAALLRGRPREPCPSPRPVGRTTLMTEGQKIPCRTAACFPDCAHGAQPVFLTFSPVFFPAGRKFSCIRALFVCGWAHYNKAVVNCRPPAAWGRCYL